MSLNLKTLPSTGGKKFTAQAPIEAGNYPARVVQIIEMGLQPQRAFKGVDKPPAREIMLTYELVDEFMKDDDGKDIEDKPRWVSEDFPLNNLDKDLAKSTKRYLVFDPDMTKFDGDITKVLGLPCSVAIVQNVKGDNIYNNVANLTAMRPRDAAACPDLKNPTKLFLSDEPDMEVFKSLPKWLQERITGNLNYKGSVLEAEVAKLPKDTVKVAEKKVEETITKEDNPY